MLGGNREERYTQNPLFAENGGDQRRRPGLFDDQRNDYPPRQAGYQDTRREFQDDRQGFPDAQREHTDVRRGIPKYDADPRGAAIPPPPGPPPPVRESARPSRKDGFFDQRQNSYESNAAPVMPTQTRERAFSPPRNGEYTRERAFSPPRNGEYPQNGRREILRNGAPSPRARDHYPQIGPEYFPDERDLDREPTRGRREYIDDPSFNRPLSPTPAQNMAPPVAHHHPPPPAMYQRDELPNWDRIASVQEIRPGHPLYEQYLAKYGTGEGIHNRWSDAYKLSQRPAYRKEDYEESAERNLHVWGRWRSNVNDGIIQDIMTGRGKDVPPFEEVVQATTPYDGSDPGRVIKDPVTLMKYSVGINQVTDLPSDEFLQYGIPRANAESGNREYRHAFRKQNDDAVLPDDRDRRPIHKERKSHTLMDIPLRSTDTRYRTNDPPRQTAADTHTYPRRGEDEFYHKSASEYKSRPYEVMSREQVSREPVSREPVSREQVSREPVSREQVSREPVSREPLRDYSERDYPTFDRYDRYSDSRRDYR